MRISHHTYWTTKQEIKDLIKCLIIGFALAIIIPTIIIKTFVPDYEEMYLKNHQTK